MITTIERVIAEKGWQVGQRVECDLWIGRDYVRHITSVQVVEGLTLLMMQKEYFCRHWDELRTTTGYECITYIEGEDIILADTKEEMEADAKILTNLIKETIERKDRAHANKILSYVEALQAVGNVTSCEVDKIIKKEIMDEKYSKFRTLVGYMGFNRNNDDWDEDDICEFQNLFLKRSFFFNDSKNSNIRTRVMTDHIVSVETHMTKGNEKAVVVNMDNGEEYVIYKEQDKSLFKVLTALYES